MSEYEPYAPSVNFPAIKANKCSVPSLHFLATIKKAHLYHSVCYYVFFIFAVLFFFFLFFLIKNRYYPVKWNSHAKKYHELTQLIASSPPAADQKQRSTYLLTHIFPFLVQEGKIIHMDKKISPHLPNFQPDCYFIPLQNSHKIRAMVELLLPYKATFATFEGALEWACTTTGQETADIIIELFPDLVEAGNSAWEASAADLQVR